MATNKAKKEVTQEEMAKQFAEMQAKMAEMEAQLKEKDAKLKKAEKQPKSKTGLDTSKNIIVRSVTPDGLTYVSRLTGLPTTWSDFGSEVPMTVGDVIRMKADSPIFFTHPWVVIDDEELIEYLGLKEIYKNIIDVDDIDDLFNSDLDQLAEKLNKAPRGTKELVAQKARQLVESGELDSFRKIAVLNNCLNVDLDMVR